MDQYDELDDDFDAIDAIDEEGDLYDGDEFLPALGALLPIAAKAAPAIMSMLGGLFEEESGEEDFDAYDAEGAGELYADDDYDSFDDGFDGEDDFDDGFGDLEEVHLVEQAKKTKSRTVAQANAGALAAKAAKSAPPKLKKKILKPLTKSSSAIVKVLTKKPASKKLIPAVPKILKRAVKDLKKKARSGQPISGKTVVRSVASQAAKVLKSKTLLKDAVKPNSLKRKVLNAQAIKRAEKYM